MDNQKMIDSVEKNLNAMKKELTAETAELKEQQKSVKGHKDALEKYKKELEDKTKADRKKIEALEKSIDKVMQEYSKLMAVHDTALNEINSEERQVQWKNTNIINMKRQLEIIKLQAEDWVIYSIDKWSHSNDYLGAFEKNNYRPQGWYVVDIIAKPTGIYMRTTLSEHYRKVSKPGEVNVAMVKRDTLTFGKKREFDNIVTGHTCKTPKKIEHHKY
jgi:seryl-tRNA synthetase